MQHFLSFCAIFLLQLLTNFNEKEKGWQKSNSLNNMQTNTTSSPTEPSIFYLSIKIQPWTRELCWTAGGISLHIIERVRFLPLFHVV